MVKNRTTRRKTPMTKEVKKSSKLVCGFCGLVVIVDESCGCVDTCDLICCGAQLQPKK